METDDITGLVDGNLKLYEHILHGVEGLFGASEKVERAEFKKILDVLEVQHNYPGLAMFVYTEKVLGSDKENFEKSIRDEGYAGFSIYPPTERNEYFPIKYVYPEEENRSLLGFDVQTSPVRYAAALNSAKTGELQTTEKILFLQDGRGGFAKGLTIYKGGGCSGNRGGEAEKSRGRSHCHNRRGNIFYGNF